MHTVSWRHSAQRFELAGHYKFDRSTTCDLHDGFYGIEVRGEDRKYLGLRHPRTGKYYRYARLAMGAACSLAAFSRLVAWAMWEARKYEELKV